MSPGNIVLTPSGIFLRYFHFERLPSLTGMALGALPLAALLFFFLGSLQVQAGDSAGGGDR